MLLLGLSLLTWLSLTSKHRNPITFGFALLFVASSLPVLHGLKWGQISIFLVVLTIAGLSKGGRFGGALIGIAAAIKGYPFVYLLHPLLRQKATPVLGAAVAFVTLGLLLPLGLLGFGSHTNPVYEHVQKQPVCHAWRIGKSGGRPFNPL